MSSIQKRFQQLSGKMLISIILVNTAPFLWGVFYSPDAVISSLLYVYVLEFVVMSIFTGLKLLRYKEKPQYSVVEKYAKLFAQGSIIYGVCIVYGVGLLMNFLYIVFHDDLPYTLGFWGLIMMLLFTFWNMDIDYNERYIQNLGYKYAPPKAIFIPFNNRFLILLISTVVVANTIPRLATEQFWLIATTLLIIKTGFDIFERVFTQKYISELDHNIEKQVQKTSKETDQVLEQYQQDVHGVTSISRSFVYVQHVYYAHILTIILHGGIAILIFGVFMSTAIGSILSFEMSVFRNVFGGAGDLLGEVSSQSTFLFTYGFAGVLVYIGFFISLIYLYLMIQKVLLAMDTHMQYYQPQVRIKDIWKIFLACAGSFLTIVFFVGVVSLLSVAVLGPFAFILPIFFVLSIVPITILLPNLIIGFASIHDVYSVGTLYSETINIMWGYKLVFFTRLILWTGLLYLLLGVALWINIYIGALLIYLVIIPAMGIHVYIVFRDIILTDEQFPAVEVQKGEST